MENSSDFKENNEEIKEEEVVFADNLPQPKNRKWVLPLILILVVVIGAALFYVFAKDSLFRDYAIRVNSQYIDKAEFDKIYDTEIKRAKEFLQKQPTRAGSSEAEFKKVEGRIKNKIVEQLCVRLMLLDEAIKEGFKAEESEVNSEVNSIKSKIGEGKFYEILKKENLNVEYVKDDIKKKIIVQKYLNSNMNKINTTDKEIEEDFNRNKEKYQHPEMIRASHILVKTEDEAKKVLKELNSGADFGKLAAERSIDPSAKLNKGDLNFFPRGAMVPEFEKAAFSTPVNKIGSIVKTQFGYHIIKVTGKQAAQEVKFEQVKELLKREIIKNKQNSTLEKLIDSLKSKAKIEVKIEGVKL